jgi:hypothetical protein
MCDVWPLDEASKNTEGTLNVVRENRLDRLPYQIRPKTCNLLGANVVERFVLSGMAHANTL